MPKVVHPDGVEIGILSDPLVVRQMDRQATARLVGARSEGLCREIEAGIAVSRSTYASDGHPED